jgi:hypothetical protein
MSCRYTLALRFIFSFGVPALIIACSPRGGTGAQAGDGFTVKPEIPELCEAGRIDCPGEMACVDGECLTCYPGTMSCGGDSGNTIEQCSLDGSVFEAVQSCPEGTDCVGGICIDPCSPDIKANLSNVGCEYFAVDLPNSKYVYSAPESGGKAAKDMEFAVVVANPDPKRSVSVAVHWTAEEPAMAGQSVTLGPNELKVFKLGARNLGGSSRGKNAFFVKGDRPFLAYQFNPLDNTMPVYSNDASLLLPVAAGGKKYIAMTGKYVAFVTIVGTQDNTEVTLVPTADLQPSTTGDPLSSVAPAGAPVTFDLDRGEVLNLLANVVEGSEFEGGIDSDLTGTTVDATRAVLVFSGNTCTTTGSRCCCDHLEQQLTPVRSWGRDVVIGRSVPRGVESDTIRIVSGSDNNKVTVIPPVAGPFILNRGEMAELTTKTENILVQAEKEIQVAQFLASSDETKVDGAYCASQADCKSGQQCVQMVGNTWICVSSCALSPSNCPLGQLCNDRAAMLDQLPLGGGWCGAAPCGANTAGCAVGSQCLESNGANYCFQECSADSQCAPPIASCKFASGTSVCTAQSCANSAGCGADGLCYNPNSGDGYCLKTCKASNSCPDKGYECWSMANSVGPVCVEPYCNTDSDCPSFHACTPFPDSSWGVKGWCRPVGDPAMVLAIPVEQYQKDYVFLVPDAYAVDYINITAPPGAQVLLDGKKIEAEDWAPLTNQWSVARLAISDGVHQIAASQPVGVTVYGYDSDVSYGYMAGTSLATLE